MKKPSTLLCSTLFVLVFLGAAICDKIGAAGLDRKEKVPPGLVQWHADYAAACAASRVSGKPVLLFQLMGQLDDRFC